jgi:type IV secretion system protein VirB10
MKGAGDPPEAIAGDRGETLVHRSASLQSRLTNLLAIALISVLGVTALTWYYAHALGRQSQTTQRAHAASTDHASGDAPIPSIGRIDPPPPPPPAPAELPDASAPTSAAMPPLSAADALPLAPVPSASSGPPPKSAAELLEERQLSGAVFAAQGSSSASAESKAQRPLSPESVASGQGEAGELGLLLKTSAATTAVHPAVLPAQRLLLPKGSFIDCTLETAIDSTLPGMTTCVMATDAFGVDGKVVLLDRGTKLVGETRGQVQQGAARLFVLWTEARTPAGVIVPLASPGADELGRSGLPGEVNRHFWERFGAALLVSVIDGAVETAEQSSRGGSGTVVIDPAASQGVMGEVLKGTINIPPTIVKRNGDRIQVLVARDIDFRPVYELRSVTQSR